MRRLLLVLALASCGPSHEATHAMVPLDPAPIAGPAGVTAAASTERSVARDLEEGVFRWSTETASPTTYSTAHGLGRQAALACGRPDGALDAVALRLAHREAAGLPQLEMAELAFALRAAGNPHVWPRAWTVAGGELEWSDVERRLSRWLEELPRYGERRCGAAITVGDDGREVLAVVGVDALGDLKPLKTRARSGEWLRFEGRLLVESAGSKAIVMGPRGEPKPIPTSIRGRRFSAVFAGDTPGAWKVQLLSNVDGGPRPVLEAIVYVDHEPAVAFSADAAPGESAGRDEPDPREAISMMLNAARTAEGRRPLTRDDQLDAIAQRHAEAMRATRRLRHDVGDGAPDERVARAGVDVASAGENVARAATPGGAHRAIWSSPSHRGNVLDADFDAMGLGVARDQEGSLWVCEVFANYGGAGIDRRIMLRGGREADDRAGSTFPSTSEPR